MSFRDVMEAEEIYQWLDNITTSSEWWIPAATLSAVKLFLKYLFLIQICLFLKN
ncbi:MAG: hypothetical protein QXF09_06020 [Nitrososphaerota archaeon]